mgnify:CR=1 FL=1
MSEKKIAVVTGGARGIGKAIALELAKAGNLVVINYNGSEEKARETKAEIEAAGGQADILQCNVADFDACEAFFKAIAEKYGRVDILVNNAGVTKDGLLMKMSEEDFSRVVDINLKGTFNCIRHVSRMMLRQRSGRIISLSSVVGLRGNAGQANYAASKAGIIGMTKSAARELASRGITVNAVAPGFIETEMTAVLSEEVKKATAAQIPLGHFGKPEDIAKTATSLRIEAGKEFRRFELIAAIMEHFEKAYEAVCEAGSLEPIMEDYNRLLVNCGRRVRVLEPEHEYDALALGIDKTGELQVECEDGSRKSVFAGEVSVRGIYGYV